MPKLILMRGLPGSGKSTEAAQLAKEINATVFTTDEFFMENGEYKFDASLLSKAHAWNYRRTVDAMYADKNVIVDNTNTQAWEMKAYVQKAKELEYDIELVEASKAPWAWDVKECANKNTHKVPLDAIQRMFNRFQRNLTIEDILEAKGR